MYYPNLMVWAFASILAIDGRSLSPRFISTDTQQSTRIATSFQQVTTTYSSISTFFSQTRYQIQTAQSFEECSNYITFLTEQITQAVESISRGCDCDVNGIDSNNLQNLIATWFAELQAITQTVQSRFPYRYQSFRSQFYQIGVKIEVALGVSYSAGVDIDNVVQSAVRRTNVNRNLFSSVGIDTSRFTRVSQSVNNRSGAFTQNVPGGTRFPQLLPIKSPRYRTFNPSRSTTGGASATIDHSVTKPPRHPGTVTPPNPNLVWPPPLGRQHVIDFPGSAPNRLDPIITNPNRQPPHNGGQSIIDHPGTTSEPNASTLNINRNKPPVNFDHSDSKPVKPSTHSGSPPAHTSTPP